MDNIDDLKKLAGVTDKHGNSLGENMSVLGNKKSQYQKKHKVKPGTDEWFKLWFSRPMTNVDPMPKKKKKKNEAVEEDAVDDVKALKDELDSEK